MKLHHLRNATLVIETQEKFILVDPMLGEKGSGLPFTLFRFKPRKNPLVNLPSNSDISKSLDFWKEHDFLGGKIIGIPAIHGYGFIAKPMGNVMGFYVELPNEKSIYISADTIYTQHLDRVLRELKPEISVLACGSAQLDFGKPLLMIMDDILKFIKNAPGKIFANHLEALNHCPTTRTQLRNELKNHQLLEKVFVPEDGESVVF